MKTIILATGNAHKVEEIRSILGNSFAYRSLRDFPKAPEAVESAATFEGNATIKAVTLARWLAITGLVDSSAYVLADDSGLEVDALNGAPGVYSARFAYLGTERKGNSPDAENNAKLLRLMDPVPDGERTARFRCVLALTPVMTLHDAASNVCGADEFELATRIFNGACEGRISRVADGVHGFGYDPLFILQGYDRSFAALSAEIKNQLSHRARALETLKAAAPELLR